MLGIGDEISIFLQALLAGNIVLLVYTCIRVFRRLIKHDLFFVSLEDFFFWVWAGLYPPFINALAIPSIMATAALSS